MFSLTQRLFALCALLVVIGLFRGWFSFSNPDRDKESNKVNISVSVDTNKLEADAQKLKKVGEKVAQRIKERHDQPTAVEVNVSR